MRPRLLCGIAALSVALGSSAAQAQSFVNFETPHVSPVDITPDGTRLLVVNLADNRLEVFQIHDTGQLVPIGDVPVGLDPVSVRARNDEEVWVVNHVSDSISVIDLGTMSITTTIQTGDEPADVVFAGTPERAYVSISQLNQVWLFDPNDLTAPPDVIDIAGEDPRQLVTDGVEVCVAIFESGNGTTIISPTDVMDASGPYGGQSPPPNDGAGFDPPLNPANPAAPTTSMIVKKMPDGTWQDDNGGDWSSFVTWDLHDNDIGIIANGGSQVLYAGGLMNHNMAMALHPASGDLTVVGTDGTNHIRFEPNLNGIFGMVVLATIDASGQGPHAIMSANPHLSGFNAPGPGKVPPDVIAQSLGDPRGVAYTNDGERLYVTGMGSNNVAIFGAAGNRIGTIEVGEGPTGIRMHPTNPFAYVVNKFDGTVSVIALDSDSELERVAFYDPTPMVIKMGRPHLYNTHDNSALGNVSCATCHTDARMDQLAWDLGIPDGDMIEFDATCINDGPCTDWHPMKGPMTTQTFQLGLHLEPLHWRGDRGEFADFNAAFTDLLARPDEKTDIEMLDFEAFLETIFFPPNPYRNLDHSLATDSAFNGGDATVGRQLFDGSHPTEVVAPLCIACHIDPFGTNQQILLPVPAEEVFVQTEVAHLNNLYEKTGFDRTSQENNRGFGMVHDGNVPTIADFIALEVITLTDPSLAPDLEAYLASFNFGTHAGIGAQAQMGVPGVDETARRDLLIQIADAGFIGLVIKTTVDGIQRGGYYLGGGLWQADSAADQVTTADLDLVADAGFVMTYTLVPFGSDVRIGVDRDEDGFFDFDEIAQCTDPADPTSFPGSNPCPEDLTGPDGVPDGVVDVTDMLFVVGNWGNPGATDLNCSGTTEVGDMLAVIGAWGACPD